MVLSTHQVIINKLNTFFNGWMKPVLARIPLEKFVYAEVYVTSEIAKVTK